MNYLKKNYNLMRSEFETIDWSEISESDDAEIVCQNIENLILDLTRRFVPVHYVPISTIFAIKPLILL